MLWNINWIDLIMISCGSSVYMFLMSAQNIMSLVLDWYVDTSWRRVEFISLTRSFVRQRTDDCTLQDWRTRVSALEA